jgi:hypothetical protein
VELTLDSLRTLLAENGGVLRTGRHAKDDCKVCVRELRCLALGLPGWTDKPARYTAKADDAAPYAASAAYSEDSAAVLRQAVQILTECHAGKTPA